MTLLKELFDFFTGRGPRYVGWLSAAAQRVILALMGVGIIVFIVVLSYGLAARIPGCS